MTANSSRIPKLRGGHSSQTDPQRETGEKQSGGPGSTQTSQIRLAFPWGLRGIPLTVLLSQERPTRESNYLRYALDEETRGRPQYLRKLKRIRG